MTRDLSAARIRGGLVMLLSHFPVYRGYGAGAKRSPMDQVAFAKALAAAKDSSPESMYPILDQLDRWLGGEPGDKVAVTRFQQLSAPVAAKSVEDTAFYRYGRLLSRNDVGFDAARFGCSVADFHAACLRRLACFPDAMLATATHDHKRGEDLRARLAVISEIPDDWARLLRQCQAIAAERPNPADEIMLYQMIVGSWPPDLSPFDQAGCQALQQRLAGWQQKALREAKLGSNWTAPNQKYEQTAAAFLAFVLQPDGPFRPVIEDFINRIAPAGAVNGLAQALLKLTVPGMPDFFQGTEFWDFSLVDPDNRRPVDYGTRQEALAVRATPWQAQQSWRDGRVKQALIRSLLDLRRLTASLFARGDYIPVLVTGRMQNQIIAFARIEGNTAILVTVPRLVHRLLSDSDRISLDPRCFHDSLLLLPRQLTGRRLHPLFVPGEPILVGKELPLDLILTDFPISVLYQSD
jgi:(1->4)-alpha-D-glucan 1-alpha-D-glucosylmutase